MRSKIVREDGITVIGADKIKSCTYTEIVNADTNLRPGCVSSAFIDVVVFGLQSEAPTVGEELTYYQIDPNGNETLIGIFYAEPSVPSRNTYHFLAYDTVSKLDVGYSERLNAIQEDFPMTLAALVSDVCTTAGVTLASNVFPMSDMTVKAFYADNLTCRNILQYAAEVAGRLIRCNTDGELVFDWYTLNVEHRVYPHSGVGESATLSFDFEVDENNNLVLPAGTVINENNYIVLSDVTVIGETYVAYKQGGMDYENYDTAVVDSVAIIPMGAENAAYIYPTSGTYQNTLTVTENLLLSGASSATYLAVAQNILAQMSAVGQYRPAKIWLFLNENPFRAGDIVKVTDIQDVSFRTIVMGMKVAQSGAYLTSTGNETYEKYTGSSVGKSLANLSASIVEIEKLKVGWAEIDEAVIDTLEANGINADEITVSGTLHSEDYVRTGTPYSDSGIGIELDNKIIAAPNFAVDENGSLYAQGGEIAGFSINRRAGHYYSSGVSHFTLIDGTSGQTPTDYEISYQQDPDLDTRIYTSVFHDYGTAEFSINYNYLPDVSYTISEVRFKIENTGGNSQEDWDAPSAIIEYCKYDLSAHGFVVLATDNWSSVRYTGDSYCFFIPRKGDRRPSGTIGRADLIRVKIKVADGDTIICWGLYGEFSSLSAGSGKSLKESPDTVYIGSDGISIGTDTCLTPDGVVEAHTLVADSSVVDDLQLHTYTSLESIGMGNTDLIADIYAALPVQSMLVAQSQEFFSTDMPSPYGVVQIIKQTQQRGSIHFYGKQENHGDWRMYLDSDGVPTGTWIRVMTGSAIKSGYSGSVSVSANSYVEKTVTFTPNFIHAPTVQLTLYSTSNDANGVGLVNCCISEAPTASGFKFRVYNADSSGRSPGVYWLAIDYTSISTT